MISYRQRPIPKLAVTPHKVVAGDLSSHNVFTASTSLPPFFSFHFFPKSFCNSYRHHFYQQPSFWLTHLFEKNRILKQIRSRHQSPSFFDATDHRGYFVLLKEFICSENYLLGLVKIPKFGGSIMLWRRSI